VARHLRETGVPARYGGEEFGIIITGRMPRRFAPRGGRRGQTFSAGLGRRTGPVAAEELVRRPTWRVPGHGGGPRPRRRGR